MLNSNRRPRTTTNREESVFPYTQHIFSVTTRKDMDGKVVSSESELPILTTAIMQIRDLCLPNGYSDSLRYDLLFPTTSNMEIRICEKVDGQWNFDHGTRQYISEASYAHVKQIVSDCVLNILSLFEQYYYTSTARATNGVVKNEEMTRFIRICGRSKLRYLRDICDLYLSFNSQSYMDIIGGLLMDNNFTVNSLIVLTGHQLLLTDKIRGNHTLIGATRRQGNDTKGEIHTKRGLSISYNKSFLLHIPRITRKEDAYTYENIELHDDSPNPTPGPSDAPSSVDQSSIPAVSEIRQHRFRTITGDQLHNEWCTKFNTICTANNFNEKIIALDFSVSSSFLDLLQILDTIAFKPLFLEINQNTYKIRCNDLVINKFTADEAFSSYDRVLLIRSVIIPLLALIEVDSPSPSDHIRAQILKATDIWDVVASIIDTVKNITG